MEAWGELEEGGIRSEKLKLQITTITRKNNIGYLNYGIDMKELRNSLHYTHTCA